MNADAAMSASLSISNREPSKSVGNWFGGESAAHSPRVPLAATSEPPTAVADGASVSTNNTEMPTAAPAAAAIFRPREVLIDRSST
ncbi:hypothetical protein L3Q67_44015 [Saccharothrix sp. AJ9571]|nr:hypothetical protein L3Q67_44015 [Saccharothrix sp. AJ9571]